MERKIGEIFEYQGEWYQCVELPSDYIGCICNICSMNFDGKCPLPIRECQAENGRSDRKDVIFKKLEKVGKPYAIYCPPINNNIFLQRYRIYETPIFNETGTVFTTGGYLFIDIEIKQKQEDMEENKLNLKPFDLEAAKQGKPVCTRDGHKARIICFDRKDIKSIVALVTFIHGTSVTEKAFYYFEDGCHLSKNDNNIYDLMMLPEKHEGWVNICKDVKDDDRVVLGRIFESREDAVESAPNNDRYITIATVRIEWEE